MDAAGLERLAGRNYNIQIQQATERMGILDLAGKALGLDWRQGNKEEAFISGLQVTKLLKFNTKRLTDSPNTSLGDNQGRTVSFDRSGQLHSKA